VVASTDVGQHILEMRRHTAREKLPHPPLGADFGRSRNEQLYVGIRRDHGADVTPVEHRAAALRREILLPLEERGADAGIGGYCRCDARHWLAAELGIVVI